MEAKPIVPGAKSVESMVLEELMQEEGEDFVEAAYMALLKRSRDATGGRIYQRALRNGTSKLQILYELSKSQDCIRAGGEIPGLADACAREGIGESRDEPTSTPPPEAAQVTRAEQLLLIDDYSKLIEVAYWVLLKRSPDSDGIANYLARLAGGTSKARFLCELFDSVECRELGVELPGLHEALAREGLDVANERLYASSAATTLHELLDSQGVTFVERAYLTLLQRSPDIHGCQHRLAQLLGGTSKIGILSEMVASKEGGSVGIKLPGLATMLSRYRLSRTPVLGGLFRRIFNLEGESVAMCRGRAAEQRLLTLEAKFAERIEQAEKVTRKISAIEKNALVSREDVDTQIAGLEKSLADLRLLLERYSGQVPIESAHSPLAPASKSTGRLALELRADEIARDLRRIR